MIRQDSFEIFFNSNAGQSKGYLYNNAQLPRETSKRVLSDFFESFLSDFSSILNEPATEMKRNQINTQTNVLNLFAVDVICYIRYFINRFRIIQKKENDMNEMASPLIVIALSFSIITNIILFYQKILKRLDLRSQNSPPKKG